MPGISDPVSSYKLWRSSNQVLMIQERSTIRTLLKVKDLYIYTLIAVLYVPR